MVIEKTNKLYQTIAQEYDNVSTGAGDQMVSKKKWLKKKTAMQKNLWEDGVLDPQCDATHVYLGTEKKLQK